MIKVVIVLLVFCCPAILVAESNYSHSLYGVSFKYSENYVLRKGELGDKYTLGYLGDIPMEFVAPSGIRIVTVSIPDSLYPNTDFGTAFVTLSVNPNTTRSDCEKFPDEVSGSQKPVVKKIGGFDFHGLEQGEAAVGHQFSGVYYHAFIGNLCYEFGKGLATAGYGAVDGLKKVDDKKVFALLDRVLDSVTIHPPKAAQKTASPRH